MFRSGYFYDNFTNLFHSRVIVRPLRFPILAFAMANLLAGLFVGLVRIGWRIPSVNFAAHHGAVMVGGFLGTLILLEKVIPLGNRVLLMLPAVNASSIVFYATGLHTIAMICLVVGAVGMVLTFVIYATRQHYDLSLMIMLAGAVSLLTGHLTLATTSFYPAALPWWFGFVLYIIIGERLELTKFLPVGRVAKYLLVGFLVLFFTGTIVSFHNVGKYLCGVSLVLVGIWLMRNDVVAVGLKRTGLTRFSALALLGGYVWLVVTGFLMTFSQDIPLGYDVLVHAFFLGFVFSMIFAHGPIILPGVLGFSVRPYHSFLFLPLALLWMSLSLRIFADLFILQYDLRLISGWASALAILLYFVTLGGTLIRALR